jgi:acyl carrier protein
MSHLRPEDIYPVLHEYVTRELLHGEDTGLAADTPLLEWGVIDSMSLAELLAFIEQRFSIQVAEEKVTPEHFQSLGALSELLAHLSEKHG